MNDFEALLNKLQTVATVNKAINEDNTPKFAKSEAGAGSGNAATDPNETGNDLINNGATANAKNNGGTGDDDDDDEQFGKSFSLQLEDGTTIDAVDGTQLVKSLATKLNDTQTAFNKATSEMAIKEDQIYKSIESTTSLLESQTETIRKQGDLIKSLSEQVNKIANSGRGRASTLSVTEKPTNSEPLNKSMQTQTMAPQEILAKSLAAMHDKKITGAEAIRIEAAINNGVAVAPELLQKINS